MDNHLLTKTSRGPVPPEIRVQPHSLEAEQSMLGAMLLSHEVIPEIAELVRSDDFYYDKHGLVYDALMSLYTEGEPVDAITVAERMKANGTLESVGGKPFIHTLLNTVPTAANARYYAHIVEKNATLRSLIKAGTTVVERGYDTSIDDVSEIIEEAESLIFDVTNRRVSDGFVSIRELLAVNFEQIEKLYEKGARVTGLATGYQDFDDMTSGLQPSDMIIIAARPAMGKTSLALNIAANVALKQKTPIAIFSLEMSENQITQRLLCAEARVDSQSMRTGNLCDDDWSRLSSALGRLAEAPIYIDDDNGVTIMEMRAKARRLKHKHGLGLIIVDYLQLMQGHRRTENRQQEISEISRSLKVIARELDVPVIAVSQLSRAPELRGGAKHRPMLSDLRESGAIEQDADLVIFIYRDDYYDQESEEKGEAEIIIAKHRNGPTGIVKMTFLEHYAKFCSISRQA